MQIAGVKSAQMRPLVADEFDAFKRKWTRPGLRNELQKVRRTNEVSLDQARSAQSPVFRTVDWPCRHRYVLEPTQLKDAIRRAHQSDCSGSAAAWLTSVLATAGSSSLVPDWNSHRIPPKQMLGALRAIGRLADPYSIAAGIELAAIAARQEPRAGQIACQIGVRLLGDERGLEGEVSTFLSSPNRDFFRYLSKS